MENKQNDLKCLVIDKEQAAMDLYSLANVIESLNDQIESTHDEIGEFDPEMWLSESLYDEFLDEGGVVVVAGLGMYPSKILSECDPISYNTGWSEWANGVDLDSIPEYNELTTQLNDLQNEVEEAEEEGARLEDQMNEIDDEIHSLNNELQD